MHACMRLRPSFHLYLGILDLIRKLLQKNPMQRMKLVDIGRHPWVLDGPSKHRRSALNESAESIVMKKIH